MLDTTFGNDVNVLQSITPVFGLTLKSCSSTVLKNAMETILCDTAIGDKKTHVFLITEHATFSDRVQTFVGLEVTRCGAERGTLFGGPSRGTKSTGWPSILALADPLPGDGTDGQNACVPTSTS
jgi:hypothetical protein